MLATLWQNVAKTNMAATYPPCIGPCWRKSGPPPSHRGGHWHGWGQPPGTIYFKGYWYGWSSRGPLTWVGPASGRYCLFLRPLILLDPASRYCLFLDPWYGHGLQVSSKEGPWHGWGQPPGTIYFRAIDIASPLGRYGWCQLFGVVLGAWTWYPF